ncbi:hypothetical protein ARMSODRAFT_1005993 [Armillaria solidipes]|uniref:Uncharacterized protein n=1 Tax=Armillaria solidipes TaxID=1076256 RepID=A0A2H3BU72_9AGAR|nr:hypothetical protein ARMSODRAFT_1005993 [Armillaria solidipes]
MSAPMTIPSLSQEDIQVILDTTNMNFNVMMMEALLFGLYTGIFGTTMWTIFSSVRSGHRTKIMTTIISCLFFLEIVTFALDWSLIYSAFVQNGWNFFTVFSELEETSPKLFRMSLVTSISSGISTLLVDVSMIWQCWTVWEQRWLVIIFPFLCCLAGTTAKVVQTYYYIYSNANDITATLSYGKVIVAWTISYISLTLATTLLFPIAKVKVA